MPWKRRNATAAEGASAAPLRDDEFAASMRGFAPFEPSPHLAVGVSGGADSMALVLLAQSWVRTHGGRLTTLTVDHGLRTESAGEARQVAAWLAARGIEHRILVWQGPYPASNLQALARAARYALMDAWCRDHHVLHLLVAHQLEDQAETFLLRLARGSGLDGLTAMAPASELENCRLLRPFLGIAGERLKATLREIGQAWLDDPSNRNPAFARVRLRAAAPMLEKLGLRPPRLAAAARDLGRAREVLDGALATALATTVRLDPAGYASLAAVDLAAYPEEIRLRSLAALLRSVGGALYPPRLETLVRIDHVLLQPASARGRTVAGCCIVPSEAAWLIFREPKAIGPPAALPPEVPVTWDRRFRVLRKASANDDGSLEIAALGHSTAIERRAIVEAVPAPHLLPKRIWPSLPVILQKGRVAYVPHLGWRLPGFEVNVEVLLAPGHALCGAGFARWRSERRAS